MGIGTCENCAVPFHKAKPTRRFCGKRCASLKQNEIRRASGDDEARYDGQVQRKGSDECWPWTGNTVVEGYGQMRFQGRALSSHVIAFLRANGPVPKGRMVLHRCGNRLCCNPGHLYAGTHSDNTLDAVRHGTFKTVFQPGRAHPNWKDGSRARA